MKQKAKRRKRKHTTATKVKAVRGRAKVVRKVRVPAAAKAGAKRINSVLSKKNKTKRISVQARWRNLNLPSANC